MGNTFRGPGKDVQTAVILMGVMSGAVGQFFVSHNVLHSAPVQGSPCH